MERKKPRRIFYVLFAYVLAFTLWWAYLLYAKNEAAYKELVELKQLRFQPSNSRVAYTETVDYKQLTSKYKRQRFMIVTEAFVFINLLLFGLNVVRRTFFREMDLANQQKNFLLSITHELKSPISTVKLSLQTLLKRTLEPEQKERLLHNSLQDVDRLETLVNNILFSAKIEQNAHGFTNEELNLSDLVLGLSNQFKNNKKNIAVQFDIDQPIYAHTDPMGFASVVVNLVENALKYSDENTVIQVHLKDAGSRFMLQVADHGYGIPAAEKKKIFDKFYRIGNEETRRSKGTGLGLFIVKRFVEIYKGTIRIEDNTPCGSVFILSFPKG